MPLLSANFGRVESTLTFPDTNLPWVALGQLPTLPRMNALTGAGSIFALFGNYYDHCLWINELQADGFTILFDWVATGNDIWAATGQFEKEAETKQPRRSRRKSEKGAKRENRSGSGQ
jgi:hypothetical protein